jgi:hypothetical protein
MNDEEDTQSKTGLNVPYIILNPMGTMGKKTEQEFLYFIRRLCIKGIPHGRNYGKRLIVPLFYF